MDGMDRKFKKYEQTAFGLSFVDKNQIAVEYSDVLRILMSIIVDEDVLEDGDSAFLQRTEKAFNNWENMIEKEGRKGVFSLDCENDTENQTLDSFILFSVRLSGAYVYFNGWDFDEFATHFKYFNLFRIFGFPWEKDSLHEITAKYLKRHLGNPQKVRNQYNLCLKKKEFSNCKFHNFGTSYCIDLFSCKFNACDFRGETFFKGRKIENVLFDVGCKFDHVVFDEATISDSSFMECEMVGTFKGANFLDSFSSESVSHRMSSEGVAIKSSIDTSGAVGIESNLERLTRFGFEFDENGNLICYKTMVISKDYKLKAFFERNFKYLFKHISKETYLEENVLYNSRKDCGHGINVGTRDWNLDLVLNSSNWPIGVVREGNVGFVVFQCKIKPQDFFDTVVPLSLGEEKGKIRAKRVYLNKIESLFNTVHEAVCIDHEEIWNAVRNQTVFDN